MLSTAERVLERAAQVRAAAVDPVADPAAEVPSPCVSVCRINAATALCEGCYRTLDEIAAWRRMDSDARRIAWVAIEQRAREAA